MISDVSAAKTASGPPVAAKRRPAESGTLPAAGSGSHILPDTLVHPGPGSASAARKKADYRLAWEARRTATASGPVDAPFFEASSAIASRMAQDPDVPQWLRDECWTFCHQFLVIREDHLINNCLAWASENDATHSAPTHGGRFSLPGLTTSAASYTWPANTRQWTPPTENDQRCASIEALLTAYVDVRASTPTILATLQRCCGCHFLTADMHRAIARCRGELAFGLPRDLVPWVMRAALRTANSTNFRRALAAQEKAAPPALPCNALIHTGLRQAMARYKAVHGTLDDALGQPTLLLRHIDRRSPYRGALLCLLAGEPDAVITLKAANEFFDTLPLFEPVAPPASRPRDALEPATKRRRLDASDTGHPPTQDEAV